jgi:hypothetical protein
MNGSGWAGWACEFLTKSSGRGITPRNECNVSCCMAGVTSGPLVSVAFTLLVAASRDGDAQRKAEAVGFGQWYVFPLQKDRLTFPNRVYIRRASFLSLPDRIAWRPRTDSQSTPGQCVQPRRVDSELGAQACRRVDLEVARQAGELTGEPS